MIARLSPVLAMYTMSSIKRVRVGLITNKETCNSTGTTFVKHVDVSIWKLLYGLDEVTFRISEPVYYGLLRILWELWVSDYKLMEVIAQEVSTWIAAMSIKYTKKGTFRPVIALLARWFHDVQNDRNAILVIISDNSLICVCSISRNDSVLPNWAFSLFKVR